MFRRGAAPNATYTFKHALVQETAFASMLKGQRKQLHGRIAAVLTTQFPNLVESEPESLARHLTEAGESMRATEYWSLASQRAAKRSANVEAVAHLRRGLELLENLPDTVERGRRELALQIALGDALRAAKGTAATETAEAYGRARQLCVQMGEQSHLPQALWGQFVCSSNRAELNRAQEAAEALSRFSETGGNDDWRVLGWHAAGQLAFLVGDFAVARRRLELAVALKSRGAAHNILGDPGGVGSLIYLALALLILGFPDQALNRYQQALTLAENSQEPFKLALSLSNACTFFYLQRDFDRLVEITARALAVAEEKRMPAWLPAISMFRGSALVRSGKPERGITLLRDGLKSRLAIGYAIEVPFRLGLLAVALTSAGKIAEAEACVADGLARAERTGEHWYDSDLHRIRGELAIVTSQPSSATAAFTQALHTAQRQGAKLYELRAATSLARLWQTQGRADEARALLAPIYGWFTESFDATDLEEAKTLLDQLGP